MFPDYRILQVSVLLVLTGMWFALLKNSRVESRRRSFGQRPTDECSVYLTKKQLADVHM